uniref:Uncharacterized protein n=1 Tax=Ciona savignyi TaxID=51511 RepID=H2YCN3_CIOSA
MSAGPLVFELFVVFCVALFLLHHYGRITKQHPAVTIATLVAWYFSLIIIFILPLDVSSTFYRQCLHVNGQDNVSSQTSTGIITENDSRGIAVESICEKPWSYVKGTTLPAMWHIVYWTSQVLTWLVLPFIQSYVGAGDFSTLGKIKRAVIENAVYYGSYLFIFGCLLIYVAASKISLDIQQLKVLLITASNTWGLFLLVLLLGYGLVEVPRGLWHAADNARCMAQTYFKLSKLSTEKQEAAEDLEDV